MKKSELIQVRNKQVAELKKELLEDRRQLVRLRLEMASAKIKNVRAVKTLRKKIAQALTIIREKQMEEILPPQVPPERGKRGGDT